MLCKRIDANRETTHKSLNITLFLHGMKGIQTISISFLILIALSFIVNGCRSKKVEPSKVSYTTDSAANYPVWIAMMENPNVNYYEAVAAFEKYWEFREKPTEDDGEARDIFGKEKSEEEKNKAANRSVEYVYEYKQFLNWQQRNKNLVKPDGTIMKPEEVIEQWKKLTTDSLNK